MEHSALRAAGYVQVFSDAPTVTADTLQCCHCAMHYVVVKGSGKKRGWCMVCNKPTCGQAKCEACLPWEQMLENIESGRDLNYKPIRASVPDVPKSHLKGGVLLSE